MAAERMSETKYQTKYTSLKIPPLYIWRPSFTSSRQGFVQLTFWLATEVNLRPQGISAPPVGAGQRESWSYAEDRFGEDRRLQRVIKLL